MKNNNNNIITGATPQELVEIENYLEDLNKEKTSFSAPIAEDIGWKNKNKVSKNIEQLNQNKIKKISLVRATELALNHIQEWFITFHMINLYGAL